jgi:hypothetical protein
MAGGLATAQVYLASGRELTPSTTTCLEELHRSLAFNLGGLTSPWTRGSRVGSFTYPGEGLGCTAVHPIVRRPGRELPEPGAWRLGSHHAVARYRLLVCVPDIPGISVTPVHARTP